HTTPVICSFVCVAWFSCLAFMCLSFFRFRHRITSFFFDEAASTEIYTLSLHDALPISGPEKDTTANMALLLKNLGGKSDRSAIRDRKSTRLNSSHVKISYAVFCLKKKR